MTADLPSKWSDTTLGELIEGFQAGRNLKANGHPASEGQYGVLKISAVTWGEFNPAENKALAPGDEPKPHEVVRAGDLLISRANTSELVGAVVRVEDDHPTLMLPDKLLRLVVNERKVDPDFLKYALRTRAVREHFEREATGTSESMRNLSQPKMCATPVRLAPRDQQRRIVEKIDVLTARSRRAKVALDAIPPLLERFRQSVLAAAFRGDLTKDWREQHPDVEPADQLLARIRQERRARWEQAELEKLRAKDKAPKNDDWKSKYVEPEPVDTAGLPELPEGWCWVPLEAVTDASVPIAYGIVQPGPDTPGGVPVIRAQDIADGQVVRSGLRLAEPRIAAQYPRTRLAAGDVLLCIIRDLRVAVVPPALAGANIVRGIVRLAPCTAMRSEQLAYWLASPLAQTLLHDMYRGMDMPVINVGDVRRVPVPVAPLAEQREIAASVERLLLGADAMTAVVRSAASAGQKLDAAILAKAFRGDLVEPADG